MNFFHFSMWFIWRPFDLAAVTSPGCIFNTRENPSKSQKSIKIGGLPLVKAGRGIGGMKGMFHQRSSEAIVNLSCGIQQRAEQVCLIYTKLSSAEWLGDNSWDILLLKQTFLWGNGHEEPPCRARMGGPAHTRAVRGFWHPKLSHTARPGGFWAASIPQEHQ